MSSYISTVVVTGARVLVTAEQSYSSIKATLTGSCCAHEAVYHLRIVAPENWMVSLSVQQNFKAQNTDPP